MKIMNVGGNKKPERWRSGTTRLVVRPEVTIVVFLMAVMLFKLKLMQPAATGPIFFAVVQHDAAILALILLLYAAGAAAARKNNGAGVALGAASTLSKLSMAASLVVALLYATDAFAYYFFDTRLYASDIVTFSSEPRAALSLLRSGWWVILGYPVWKLAIIAAAILLLLRAYYLLLAKPLRPPPRSRFLAATAIPLAILSFVPVPGYVYSFGDKPLYENFIQRNANFFVRSNFSDTFRAKIMAVQPAENCMPGRGRRLNVILLIIESLSAYHSRLFSGVEDWTPHLDEIARRETALPNFYANGWTTIGGLISLLTRTFPFVPEHTQFNKWGSPRLTDFLDASHSLPRVLSERGYTTEFVAAGNLKFLGQDAWLRTIGFQNLIGDNDSRFARQKVRGPFNSVPDQLLYDVALEESAQMPTDKPYFMVVQTFWSHRPFTDPNGGKLDGEEPVIRETDAQIETLYERLMAAGFFQKGLLFITGDHRAPEPFQKAEFERFGASAVARVPAVIVTRAIELPRVLTQDFQQRDFGASIEAVVGNQYCLGPQEGAFLSDPPKPASCIMHAHGDDRDLILVKCGTREGTVRASGDATRFASGAVDDEASVIQTINRTRVRPVQ
jgi:phosphoglycerol transferase MdoB-like AlkP superfamily enzyme